MSRSFSNCFPVTRNNDIHLKVYCYLSKLLSIIEMKFQRKNICVLRHTKTLYHSKSYNHFSGNPKLHLLKPCVCGIIEAQLSSCNLMLLRRKRSRKETKWYQKPFSEDKDFDKWRLIIIFILKFSFVNVGVHVK